MNEIPFIAGSGRSGTTWVLDALAKANRLRPVFEPLNPYTSDIGFRYAHRTLLADDSHPELKTFFRDTIEGRRERLWTQLRRQRPWLIPNRANLGSMAGASRYLRRLGRFMAEAPQLAYQATLREPIVKCIWGNLMLGWIAEQLDCRIVMIVRHPGAVIESELRTGWDAGGTLDRFRMDPGFHEATDGRYRRLLDRTLSHVEALALRWLIENQAQVEGTSDERVTVTFYEDLVDPQQDAWEPVCRHLGLLNRPDVAVLARPSQQSHSRATREPGEATSASWRSGISAEQCSQVQAVLDEAEFGAYEMNVPRPLAVSRSRSSERRGVAT